MGSAQAVWELSRAVLSDGDGIVAVFKVYMDESGVHDGSPVVTVGAYLARPREWKKWTTQWNIAKRPIKIFHAADAANLQGEFKGWQDSDRDELVKRLLPVIAERPMPGIVIGIHLHEYNKVLQARPDLEGLFGTPYAACFQWLVQTIMFHQTNSDRRDRIAFVHECNNFQGEALEAFNYVKTYSNPNECPIGILFGEKKDYVPLQAADVLAYEGNKRMRDPSRPERRPWKILTADDQIYAAHYGRENMPDLISRLDKIKQGKIGEVVLNSRWKKFLTPSFLV